MAIVKKHSIIEVVRNDKVFHFQCDPEASLGDVFEALREMEIHVVEIIKKSLQPQEVEVNEQPNQ